MHTMIYLLFLLHFLAPTPVQEVCISSEEEKLFTIINNYRDSLDLPVIAYSAALTKVAQAHVRDLDEQFNLDAIDQCNPHSWSDQGTWTACCYTSDHKAASCMWDKPREIAAYDSPGYEIVYYSSGGATAEMGLKGWVKSPAHHPLIINAGLWEHATWKGMGIGVYGNYAAVWFGELEDPATFTLCLE